MRSKKYPLSPLVRVRKEQVDASAKALGGAVRAREAAERERAAAEEARAKAAAEANAARAAEQVSLGSGALTVADLQRLGAWEAKTAWDDAERARAVAGARDVEARARGSEGNARLAVANAEARSKVVTGHRDRWVTEGARADEAVAEEGALEAWRPRP